MAAHFTDGGSGLDAPGLQPWLAVLTDLFPSRRGRPSTSADVIASEIVLQTLHGLWEAQAVEAVTFDLRWKAACGLAVERRASIPRY